MGNRILKESICTSDTVDQMTWFEECFFTRLLTACDDFGRMDARPAILKSRLFPLKERLSLRDIQSALDKMADIGCVITYECDGKPYLYLPSWEVHQQIRARKSKYPAPDEACNQLISDDIRCNQLISDDINCCPNPIQSNPIQSESESKSESKKARASAGSVFRAYAGEDTELLQALLDFEEMRRKSRKPLTDKARRLILADLEKLSRDKTVQKEILDQSVKRGWMGVFPLKAGPDKAGHAPPARSAGESLDLGAFERAMEAKAAERREST